MTNLLNETRNLLKKHSVKLKKWMGQNFLIDPQVLDKQIAYSNLERTDTVLEIGAGTGILTKLLAERVKKVIAVEKDSRFIQILKKQCGEWDNIKLIHADILKLEIPPFTKVVSNIPYSISSPLTFKLLSYDFDYGIITYQFDFAERLTAKTGSREYSRLSVTSFYHAKVNILEKISRSAFYPMPRVDSALVKITPRPPPFHVENEKLFYNVIRALFCRKNRKARTMLAIYLDNQEIPNKKHMLKELTRELPFLKKRVRQLSPEEFGLLTNHLWRKITPIS